MNCRFTEFFLKKNLLKRRNNLMDLKDGKEILKDVFCDGQVPESYFQNMEDRVLKNYHKRQKARTVRVFSLMFLLCVAVLSAVVYLNFDNTKTNLLSEQVKSLQDTIKQQNNSLTSQNIDEDLAFVSTESEKELNKTVRPAPKKSSSLRHNENNFTKEELDYLENYLNEDNYELVYNTIMKY